MKDGAEGNVVASSTRGRSLLETESSKDWGASGVAHAWLMTLGFGILMPIAILAAVGLRSGLGHRWFEAHKFIMLLSLALIIAGLATGKAAVDDEDDTNETHKILGITASALVFFQAIVGFIRPQKENKKLRTPWNLVHHNIGRVSIILGIANIYYGLLVVYPLATWTYATFSAVLGVLAIAFVALTLYKYKRVHSDTTKCIELGQSGHDMDSKSPKLSKVDSVEGTACVISGSAHAGSHEPDGTA